MFRITPIRNNFVLSTLQAGSFHNPIQGLTVYIDKVSKKFDLLGKNIRTFGIVAYGRDFVSDVSVSEIISIALKETFFFNVKI